MSTPQNLLEHSREFYLDQDFKEFSLSNDVIDTRVFSALMKDHTHGECKCKTCGTQFNEKKTRQIVLLYDYQPYVYDTEIPLLKEIIKFESQNDGYIARGLIISAESFKDNKVQENLVICIYAELVLQRKDIIDNSRLRENEIEFFHEKSRRSRVYDRNSGIMIHEKVEEKED